ncbi:oligosaccharide flippase family protein [Streptomyces sp. NPDC002896]|uniref:oligosaccharide flippase family protein n=1 Tax=Streptomyces sp. NPDC002896 TaxID=3154438 RepID=UPI0033279A40
MAAQGISLVAQLVAVPIVARRLGTTEFGLWLSLTTAFGMLAVLDFGMGPAVMGQIAAARGRGDVAAMRRVVSSAFLLLSGAAVVLLAVAVVLVPVVDWRHALGVGVEVPGGLVGGLLLATAATVAVRLPLTIARHVYYALERGHVVAFLATIGVLLQVGGLMSVATLAPTLAWFFVTYLVTSLIAGAATTALLLGRFACELRPHLHHVDRRTAGLLGREGMELFALNAIGVVAFQTDSLIIGHYLGASRVPEYAMTLKVFALVPAFAAMFLTPLWAAYREAWARGDHSWVHNAYVRSMAFTTAAAVLIACLLVVLTPSLLTTWLGEDVVSPPTMGLLAALACYVVVMCASSAVSVFLNGSGVVRMQLWLGGVMAVLNVATSIWAVQHVGVVGPPWATVVTQTSVVLVPCLFYARRRLVRQRESTQIAMVGLHS